MYKQKRNISEQKFVFVCFVFFCWVFIFCRQEYATTGIALLRIFLLCCCCFDITKTVQNISWVDMKYFSSLYDSATSYILWKNRSIILIVLSFIIHYFRDGFTVIYYISLVSAGRSRLTTAPTGFSWYFLKSSFLFFLFFCQWGFLNLFCMLFFFITLKSFINISCILTIAPDVADGAIFWLCWTLIIKFMEQFFCKMFFFCALCLTVRSARVIHLDLFLKTYFSGFFGENNWYRTLS